MIALFCLLTHTPDCRGLDPEHCTQQKEARSSVFLFGTSILCGQDTGSGGQRQIMASTLFWRSKKGDEDYAQRKQFAGEKRGSRRMSWSPFSKKKKRDAPAAVDPAGWQSPPLTTAVSRPHYANPVYPSTFFASSFIHSPAPPARRTFPFHSTADFPVPCTPWATGWASTDSFDPAEPEYEDDPAVHVRLGDFRSRAKLTCQSVLSLGKKTVSLGLRRGSRAEGMRSEVWNNVSWDCFLRCSQFPRLWSLVVLQMEEEPSPVSS